MFISEITSVLPDNYNSKLEEKIYQKITELNIPFERVDNDSVESMAECIEISNKLGAEIRKTIVVCNEKKTKFYLIVLPADKRFDSKLFRDKMQCSRVSFASSDDMQNKLGVIPGSATILSIINDTDNDVEVVIDKEVADSEYFSCNTSDNRRHIKIKTEDLINKLLTNLNHKPTIIEL